MKKLIIYTNGQQFYVENGISMSPSGATIKREIDVTKATTEEIKQLELNPNDTALIAKIQQRK